MISVAHSPTTCRCCAYSGECGCIWDGEDDAQFNYNCVFHRTPEAGKMSLEALGAMMRLLGIRRINGRNQQDLLGR